MERGTARSPPWTLAVALSVSPQLPGPSSACVKATPELGCVGAGIAFPSGQWDGSQQDPWASSASWSAILAMLPGETPFPVLLGGSAGVCFHPAEAVLGLPPLAPTCHCHRPPPCGFLQAALWLACLCPRRGCLGLELGWQPWHLAWKQVPSDKAVMS